MRRFLLPVAILAITLVPAAIAAPVPLSNSEASRRITTEAGTLFEVEKKVALQWSSVVNRSDPEARPGDAVGNLFYDDVMALLDSALSFDNTNLHAHALSAEVLLIKSYEGQLAYNICTLLEAGKDADYVIRNEATATPADLQTARRVKRDIAAIPPAEIPDPAEGCSDDEGNRAVTVSLGPRS